MYRFLPDYTNRIERNILRGATAFFILLPIAVLAWDRSVNDSNSKSILTATLCWALCSAITFGLGYKIRDLMPENEPSFLPTNRI